MEPAPDLGDEQDATPAPQVELRGQPFAGRPDLNVDMPLDVTLNLSQGLSDDLSQGLSDGHARPSDDSEAPYLRMRPSNDETGGATPTPMLDLTDLAIPFPEIPRTPSRGVDLGAIEFLDPGDYTGVTPVRAPTKRSRISLTRPRLAGLGVLAFAAGLFTAAAARVVARPIRTALTGASANASAPASARAIPSDPIAAPPSAATVAVIAAAPAVAATVPAEAREAVLAEAEAPTVVAPLDVVQAGVAAPAAKNASATTGGAKLRTRGAGSSTARGRARAPGRGHTESHGESAIAESATESAPASSTKDASAATTNRPPNWVDPFAE